MGNGTEKNRFET